MLYDLKRESYDGGQKETDDDICIKMQLPMKKAAIMSLVIPFMIEKKKKLFYILNIYDSRKAKKYLNFF